MSQHPNKTERLLARSIELMNQARSRHTQGDAPSALALLEQAEELRRGLPAPEFMESMPSLLIAKAGLKMSLSREDEALDCLREAEKIFKELGDLNGIAHTLELRIDILRKLGRLEEAVLHVGRKMAAEAGQMPSDGGLPSDYWLPRAR
jgi:tetratricopeptide (TPR) repeat protein